MTFEERIKELTTPQLKRLIAILDQIDGKTIHEFDALIASLKTPQPVLSEKAANLIGARTYELQIYNFLDPEIAHAQAMEEFASGDLPRKQLPRRRYTDPKPQPERPTAHATVPELSRPSPASNMHLLATVGADPSSSTVGPKPPIPNNVGPIPARFNLDNFVGKCFGVDRRHDDIW